jgi:predicted DNA-binding protein
MLTINLAPETESRLQAEASRHLKAPADYARKLIEDGLAQSQTVKPALDALSKWEAMNETSDPEEIARRQVEFEEFKAGMNQNRLEMEGPTSRKIYP